MSQPLPIGEFRWIDVRENKVEPKKMVETLAKNSNWGYGCLLEVDVEYPRELHNHHNDLPFLCQKIKVNGGEKLVPNLYDKEKYLIHVKALKQALDHGLVLKEIHRVIQFKQSAWMKGYIDFNTRLRQAAKNDFEKISTN